MKHENFECRINMKYAFVQDILIFENFKMELYVAK